MIAENGQELATLLEEAVGTLLVATRYDTPEVQEALAADTYAVSEAGDGDFHLTVVGRPNRATVSLPVNTSWDEIEVAGLTGYDEAIPGEVLPLDMRVAGRTDGSLKMSVRLVDPAGQTVAQHDVTLTPDVRARPADPAGQPRRALHHCRGCLRRGHSRTAARPGWKPSRQSVRGHGCGQPSPPRIVVRKSLTGPVGTRLPVPGVGISARRSSAPSGVATP